MSSIQAATFDLWNTVIRDEPATFLARADRRVALAQSFFAAADKRVLSEPLRWAIEAASSWIDKLRDTEQRHPSPDEIGHLIASQVGFRLELDDAATLAGVVSSAGAEHPAELTPGAAETLTALNGRLRMGLISDTVLTGGRHMLMALEKRGLAGVFEIGAFSDQTLTTKPQARQFLYALYMLGVTDPATAVHVGDRELSDVAGAQAVGMKTIRVVSPDEDPDKVRAESAADAVAADMTEVGRILDLML